MAGGKHLLGMAHGRHVFGTAKVGERGQIVIPKDARALFGIQPGDTEFYNPMSPEVFDAVDAVYDAVAANDFSHFVRLGQEQ